MKSVKMAKFEHVKTHSLGYIDEGGWA